MKKNLPIDIPVNIILLAKWMPPSIMLSAITGNVDLDRCVIL